jgi:hypothetical protein
VAQSADESDNGEVTAGVVVNKLEGKAVEVVRDDKVEVITSEASGVNKWDEFLTELFTPLPSVVPFAGRVGAFSFAYPGGTNSTFSTS